MVIFLTKNINYLRALGCCREHGTMLGKIVAGDAAPESIRQLDPSKENVVAHVSTKVIDLVVFLPAASASWSISRLSSKPFIGHAW